MAFARTHEFSFHWKEDVHSSLKTENENLEKTLSNSSGSPAATKAQT